MKLIRPDGSVVSSKDVENVFTWADGRASWREWDYDGIETFPYTVCGRWEPEPPTAQEAPPTNPAPENPDQKTEQAPEQSLPMEPPPGSWAAVARMMAAGDDSGFDWDAWKDEMKERDL